MKMDSLFRKRIGITEEETITFERLEEILRKTAQSLPFENLAVIDRRASEITEENLVNKILLNQEGGLCYELNPMLYFFLIENGFHAELVRGRVYDNDKQAFQPLDRTHVTILVSHQQRMYLIDTGFGGNLPLKPVPLTGETVKSANGEFRVKKIKSDHGNYMLEMKLKYRDTEWKIGYVFDSNKPVEDLSELNEIGELIMEQPQSPFNKSPLLSRFTESGRIVLTNSHLTRWVDGSMEKEVINQERFNEIVQKEFGINVI
ncbi:arylamine N-acetyltransferase family protein [Oceanobacillus piezotolerans]